MNFLRMLTIVGVVILIWYPNGHADRLYTWEDDSGVSHISKDPPPQKAKLIDIMDYTESNTNNNQATGGQISNEAANKNLQRVGVQKEEKVTGTTDTTEDVEEEMYYDSNGGLYTKRAIKYEIKKARQEQLESGQENDRYLGDPQDGQEQNEESKDARQKNGKDPSESDRSVKKKNSRRSHGRK